ncbi:MAG: 30S ribosomal protein S12 methylthiotransferase RimO [Nitrospirae bacterium]|nr:30S ribosomal protein S12 methylthiotransferase RimO [Nitrospirota bacterium]
MKLSLINLGCPKNQVDSEIMLGLLHEAGFEFSANEEEADIIIVNTCGFIDAAKEESVNTLIQLGEYKNTGRCRLLIASGCLSQRYKDELLKELPEIDAVVGTGSFTDVVEICRKFVSENNPIPTLTLPLKGRENNASSGQGEEGFVPRHHQIYISDPSNFNYESPLPRIRISPAHTAFVKIAEGCDHTCTFCIIPELRGRQRSRSIESIAGEVERLASEGVVEINLVAQDSTAYGRDLKESNALSKLLRRLANIKDIKWIRLLYTYPGSFTKDLIEVMAGEEKVCKYIDMPVQHINDTILNRMHRGHTRKSIYRTVETLREKIHGVILRTSLIVGFPGETEEQFNELAEFVKDIAFERLGVFTYSNEEGTGAYAFSGQIKEKEMKKRRDTIMKIQQKISLKKNRQLIGSKQMVLVDGPSQEAPYLLEGRTSTQAPEIDGVVYLTDTAGNTPIQGEIIPVEITDAHPYDLIGKAV